MGYTSLPVAIAYEVGVGGGRWGLQCRLDAVGEKTCFSQELNPDLSAVEPITVSLRWQKYKRS